MSYIPPNAEWYVAELVQEITVEGDDRNVVHRNLVLVRAQSPEEAFSKANELGRNGEGKFPNPSGKQVLVRFRGLCSLDVVHDKLEHGAELVYSESIGMPESEITRLLVSKEELGAFNGVRVSKGPDYSSGEVMTEAMKLISSKNGY